MQDGVRKADNERRMAETYRHLQLCRDSAEECVHWGEPFMDTEEMRPYNTNTVDFRLKWLNVDRDRYAHFRVALKEMVGLDVIKEYIFDTITDVAGR